MEPIILASSSPRRRALMSLLGVAFRCVAPDADETLPKDLSPPQGVMALAKRKAQRVSKRYPKALCIGADTMVVHRGRILGKPRDVREAYEMLSRLENDAHDVYTGLCVLRGDAAYCRCDYRHTMVRFLPMNERDIQSYIRTGEPMDKAGGYGIQGKASAFIHGIVGSHDNVIGLPLALLRCMLIQAGVDV